MTIAPYEQPAPLPTLELDERARGWVTKLRAAAEIAAYIGGTEFVPDSLRNRPEAITAAILYGEALGLPPIVALSRITVIKGRPTLTSEAQRSLILAAGHEIWFEETTVTRAIVAGRRRGEERVSRITFTLDDAKRAGLAGQQNWRTYPAEMLRARASAALARVLFADVIGGLAASEELDDTENGVIPTTTILTAEAEPTKTTRTRKRATAARPPVAPTPTPDTQPEPETPAAEPPATEAAKRRIFAAMRDQGFTERQHRLAYVSRIAGRKIESSNDLTASEASKVIQALEGSEETPPPDQPDPDTGADTTDEEERLNQLMERLDQAVADSLDKRTATIHDLWEIMAAFRHRLVPDLINELAGSPEGQLLWQPLRDNLTAGEAADLLTHLNARLRQLNPDDIPY